LSEFQNEERPIGGKKLNISEFPNDIRSNRKDERPLGGKKINLNEHLE